MPEASPTGGPLLLPQPVWRLALWLCLAAILLLALMGKPPRALNTGWDKSNHALAFAVLAFIALNAYRQQVVLALAGLLTYGGMIELLQSLTPKRSGEWGDLLADAVGLALGYGLAMAAARVARPQQQLTP